MVDEGNAPTIVAGHTGWNTSPSPTGRNPRFWEESQQTILLRWKADYLANTSNPATRGGKWYKQLVDQQASLPNANIDVVGFGPAILYLATGDAAHVAKFLACQAAWLYTLPGPPNWNTPFQWDSNYVRNWWSRLIWCLEVVWGGLTDSERVTLYGRVVENLEKHEDFYSAFNGWQLGDSDQVIGPYTAVAMLKLLFPAEPRIDALWTNPKVGGLTSTASNYTSTCRNAIRHYIDTLAVGGQYIESTAYDWHTTQFFLECYTHVKRFHSGTDYFPEIAAWLPDFAKALITIVTPDNLYQWKYGDDETPTWIVLYEWAATMQMLAGLIKGTAAGRQLKQFCDDLGAQYGDIGGASTFAPNLASFHQFFAFDDTASTEAYKVNANRYFFASGIGAQRLRSGWTATDSLYGTLAARRLQDSGQGTWWVDHLVRWHNSPWLYKNGETIFRPLVGYNGANISGEAVNCTLKHGIGDCWEYKDVVAHDEATTHAYLASTTGGSLCVKGLAITYPPNVVHEDTRSTLYVPGATDVIVVCDRLYVDDILAGDVSKYPGTGDATNGAEEEDYIARKFARVVVIEHMQVIPTVAGDVTTWTTAGGQKAKISWLNPAGMTSAVINEKADWQDASPQHRYGWHTSNIVNTAIWYQEQRRLNTTWNAVVHVNAVHGTTTPATATKLEDAGKAIGAHQTRTGETDIVAVFNGTQSPAINTTAYHASNVAALAAQHYHAAKTFTIGWTASNATTELYLADLNPALSWTLNVDGGGANGITPSATGFYRTTVSGTGARTITVVGT